MKFGKVLLTALFASSLVVANITAAKLTFFQIPYLGGVAVPAGFVAIAVSFLWTDILGELYGRDTARKVVNAVIISLVVAWGLIYVSILLPVAPFYEHNVAFETIMGSSTTIVLASILTLLVSQNLDVSIFHWLRERTDRRHKWVRNVGSTATSQLVDTALFIGLAFMVLPYFLGGTVLPLGVVVGMVIGQYVVKVVVALLDTPLFYAITGLFDTKSELFGVPAE